MDIDVKNELSARAAKIEEIIYAYLPTESGMQQTVFDAMRYSIASGGKRLRPILMNEVYKLFNGTTEAINIFMAAIEMIHTYSLVHDDLPAMDDDMLRRGKPTTHAVYGEAMGILAGDALLNYAFETAIKALDIKDVSTDVIIRSLKVLSKKAGIYGMIGGQVVDVEAEKNQLDMTEEKLDFIYEHKTGALIEASMEIGAILAGASDDEINLIGQVAAKVGLAFQIQDDILDRDGYVAFAGIEKSKEEVKRLTDEAIAILEKLPNNNEFLKNLLVYLIDRDY